MFLKSTGLSLVSLRVLCALLLSFWLSEMASASPTRAGKTPEYMQRRATTARAAATGTASATATRKALSLAVIIIIIVAVVVVLLILGALAFFCYRKRTKARKNNNALNMPGIGQQPPSSRPLSGTARREADWWVPPGDEAATISSHTNVPYSQGGHGYTYGRTLDPASAGTMHMAGTRTSVGSHVAHNSYQEEETERPFQIPVLRPAPPPSIAPSYHTYSDQGDMRAPNPNPNAGYALPAAPYTAPTNAPPTSFQPRPDTTIPYIQPQATGTSIYSNPYEVTAMTQSTSGHPGN